MKVYGALLRAERGLSYITLALVYPDIASGQETRLTLDARAEELAAFFADQCQRFLAWPSRRPPTASAAMRGSPR